MTTRRQKRWSQSVGPYGARIRIFERRRAGQLFATVPTSTPGRYAQVRLKGFSRQEALAWAQEQSARLLRGEPVLRPGQKARAGLDATWANLFAFYLEERTPQKSTSEQRADTRRVLFWSRMLGASSRPERLTPELWLRVQRDRASGAIDALGEAVLTLEDRRAVRPRVVQLEAQWLKQVCRWALDNWRDALGEPILARSPVQGLKMPLDGEPRRPVVTSERFAAVREAAERVEMEDRAHGGERRVSYLPEILDLLWLTGHRVTAVLKLQWQDVVLEVEGMPQGAIRWKGANDKTGFEHTVPMSAAIRAVVDRIRRQRPGVGAAYLFPKPTTHLAPISKERVRTWLLRAERLAKVPKHDGSLFHAYRRSWATARKHLPLNDVALAGGWKRVETVMRHYQATDAATVLRVLEEPGQVRERQA